MIQASTASDFITNSRIKENSDTIAADGFFELYLQTDYIQPVFLNIDNVTAELYVTPDFVYGITIPEADQTKNINHDVDLPINIGVLGTDSTELNALIFDYQEQFNKAFTSDDGRFLNKTALFKRCDSLQRFCGKRYANIKNEYFKNYVLYSIASTNANLSRGENFLIQNYITGKPINYTQKTYMDFFHACFNGYLAKIASQRKGESLYNIINTRADYPTLLNFVRFEKELHSDSIRELLIISELWDYYFRSDFEPEAVKNIISQLNVDTKIEYHKKITAAMMAVFNKMQVGAPAPGFAALTKDKKITEFGALKGRWIYLNFFSTQNIESMKEMPKIASLKKKFGDKMLFVSVCLDDSINTYQSYLKSNSKFDWPIWYFKNTAITKTAKEAYNVIGTEAYFLINNFGTLSQSPAQPPSKGIEYKLNVIFKVKPRTTKTGIR